MILHLVTESTFQDVGYQLQQITPHIISIVDDRILMIYRDLKDLPSGIFYHESLTNDNHQVYYYGVTADHEYCFFDERVLEVMQIRNDGEMTGKTILIEEKPNSDDPCFTCKISTD